MKINNQYKISYISNKLKLYKKPMTYIGEYNNNHVLQFKNGTKILFGDLSEVQYERYR